MNGDFPDIIIDLRHPDRMPLYWPEFPHRLVLLPAARSLKEVLATASSFGCFLIDPDCAAEVLNGAALDQYVAGGVPVFLHARRARDLRPFLRRAEGFARRGYKLDGPHPIAEPRRTVH